MNFGEKLQQLRRASGMSQEELAQHLSVSRQAVSKWELNSSLPDINNILQISALFDVTTDWLLKDNVELLQEKNNESSQSSQKNGDKNKWFFIGGISCIAFSSISLFIVWILSKVYPAPICFYNIVDKKWKVGFENFIWVHGLEGFVTACYIIFFIGILIIILIMYSKKAKIIYNKIRMNLKRTK